MGLCGRGIKSMMRPTLLLFFLSLVLGIIIYTYILKSEVILKTEYFSREEEVVDERIVTMKKACLKYADKWTPEFFNFSKVDRFSLGC